MAKEHFTNCGSIEHMDGKGHFYYNTEDANNTDRSETVYAMSSIHGLVKLGLVKANVHEEYTSYTLSELGIALSDQNPHLRL